jgi:DNA polymerase I-like protein with 3'-5' exonuclease and polymerase domains
MAPFLSPEHAQYLTAHAVDTTVAANLGVRSLLSADDVESLPAPLNQWANFPAILFPWIGPDGRTEYQIRPDNPTNDTRGRPRKYVFRRDMSPVLWEVRPGAAGSRMVIVEGTKQTLAAASYAPEGIAVYGIAGCRMWMADGVPIPDLAVAEDREVVILLDADAAGNADVYAAGMSLAEALAMEGAAKVTFGRLPAGDKTGLDDLLATRAPERRHDYLGRIINAAKAKPADKVPPARKRKADTPGAEGRVTVVCNQDRHDVINALATALIQRWDATELFNHGGIVSRLGSRGMVPVDRGTSRDIIQATCITVDEMEGAQGTDYKFTWPDGNSIAAVLSRADKFSPLEAIARAPYVRPDGTVVTEPGYDEATRTVLILDPALAGLEVPEDPSPEQIKAARDLIMDEWLGDFPFDADADRANALGLVVTPAIRGLVPRVPLAVVDGLQMGVGKNLLADVILTVHTGEPARPLSFVDEKEEMRKQITAAFRTGADFFVFDEAHTIEGAALAQALTAATWQDRILGVSNMAEFPNRVTWISLGNQVQVRGDLTRRVYRIALRPTYANPQDRKAETFRHPDLGSWTRAHRRELLVAVLTLVRAWFAAGQPYPARGVSFGSFETWERYVGGIVEMAGLPGFLANLKVWRSESDFDTQYWRGHLEWLLAMFEANPFRTADVRTKAMTDPAAYMAPPKLDDPSEKGYGKALGEAYSRLRGRRYDGLWIERLGSAHGHVSVWTVHRDETPVELPPVPPVPPAEPTPDTEVSTDLTPAEEADLLDELEDRVGKLTGTGPLDTDAAELMYGGKLAELVTLDLETGDANELHASNGPGYIRLSGVATDAGPVQIEEHHAGAELVARAIEWGAQVTGHNIMAFDLPALVRAGVLTMPRVHELAAAGRLFDGLLAARHIDPPMARDKGVDATRKYDLDSLGIKYELGEKSEAAKRLAKKYGGWGAIPIDSESEDGRAFRAYLEQDVNLSRALHGRLVTDLGGQVPPYLVREHRVAAIAAQISLNGFRVDVPELERRVAEIEQRKAGALEMLHERYGIPLVNDKGEAHKAPLGTKAGKEALTKALREAGATSIWTTEKTGEIQVSADHMLHLGREYHHSPQVLEIVKAVYRIVSARTVYETIHNHLIGDRVHPKVSFKQATGRWSLTEPGLTVLGKRQGRHVERAVFLPEPGHVLVTVDLSQVDMRGVAGLSQDYAYIEMLRTEDPHTEIAKLLFGDADRREDAKRIGHGWNYGRGIKAISMSEEIEPALVVQFDASMRERFPRLVEWRDEVREVAASGQLLDNGFGRPMRADPQRAHTQGPALMGQGSARDLMAEGFLDVPPEVLPYLRAQIHDEVVLSVPVGDAEDVRRAVVEAFTREWRGVPILADSSPFGADWSKCYEKG